MVAYTYIPGWIFALLPCTASQEPASAWSCTVHVAARCVCATPLRAESMVGGRSGARAVTVPVPGSPHPHGSVQGPLQALVGAPCCPVRLVARRWHPTAWGWGQWGQVGCPLSPGCTQHGAGLPADTNTTVKAGRLVN